MAVAVVFATLIISYVLAFVLKATGSLRIFEESELMGMDPASFATREDLGHAQGSVIEN